VSVVTGGSGGGALNAMDLWVMSLFFLFGHGLRNRRACVVAPVSLKLKAGIESLVQAILRMNRLLSLNGASLAAKNVLLRVSMMPTLNSYADQRS
jgi:hypothetical protein